MTIEQMQMMYDHVSAFKDAMRKHAIDSVGQKHDFFSKYRSHTDNIAEVLGTLSANITIQKILEKNHA
jgi:hypothetical protein